MSARVLALVAALLACAAIAMLAGLAVEDRALRSRMDALEARADALERRRECVCWRSVDFTGVSWATGSNPAFATGTTFITGSAASVISWR